MNTEYKITGHGGVPYVCNTLIQTFAGAACGSIMGVAYMTIASLTAQTAFIGVAIVLAVTGSALGLLRAIAEYSK